MHTIDRPRGVKLHLLDIHRLEANATEQLADGSIYSVGFGPWAAVEHGDRLYAVCVEGVGYEVTEAQPLELDLYKETPGHISIIPSFRALLSPADVRDLITPEEVDLADHVRTFGARLEGNFWGLHQLLNDKEA